MARPQQTWTTFKLNFIAANKDWLSNKTLEDAEFHNANGVTGTDTVSAVTEFSALTEAITAQTAKNQDNFNKMMELFKASKNGNTKNNRSDSGSGTTKMSYCWTHGRSDNLAHTGETCWNKADGHIDTATWMNKQGGSEKDYSKKEWKPASTPTIISTSHKNNKLSLQQIDTNVTVDALNSSSRLIVDTESPGHFVEMNADYLKKLIPADPPILVLCPSGASIKSTHIAEFNFENFLLYQRIHIFPSLASGSGSLLSIG